MNQSRTDFRKYRARNSLRLRARRPAGPPSGRDVRRGRGGGKRRRLDWTNDERRPPPRLLLATAAALLGAQAVATYDGAELGLALFLAWCALDTMHVRLGLLAGGLAMSVASAATLFAWMTGMQPSLLGRVLGATEIALTALCGLGLYLARRGESALAPRTAEAAE